MRWAETPEPREQSVLFAHRLDDAIASNHVVRELDKLLGLIDWSFWEAAYHGALGQPPIHPRVKAGVLLYGLMTRIRSSRALEDALQVRLDFRWLANGHTLDHTTLSEFRRKHPTQLRDVFIKICLLARELGLLSLSKLGFDGTRVQANNRPSGTRTPEELRRLRDELRQKFQTLEQQANAEDARDEELFPPPEPQRLSRNDAQLRQRLEKLEQTLNSLDAAQNEHGAAVPQRIPCVDLDARIMPNKEGGFAPNYTPTATVDIDSGLIVHADVLNCINEDAALIPAVQQVQQDFSLTSSPAVLADGLNATGANLATCEQMDVEIFSPGPAETTENNPASRTDLTQPVAEVDWPKLPVVTQNRGGKKFQQLDKTAFVYDANNNCYWCALGRPLPYKNTTSEKTRSGRRIRQRYQALAESCTGCPLQTLCAGNSRQPRMINREQYEAHRERQAHKMAQPEAKAVYKQRMPKGERPFAVIKDFFGLRQFLLRGLDHVRTEWLWAAISFNLLRILGWQRSRAGPARAN